MKTLQEFSFEAVYQEIISQFDVIFQKEKKLTNVTDDSQGPAPTLAVELSDEMYVLSQKERNKALDNIRFKLDDSLIGPYSEERQNIVDRFIKSYSNNWPSRVDYNLCLAFFKCLLDQSFTKFNLTGGEEVYHPFNHFNPVELLPVISQRSPDLQSLSFVTSELVTETLIPTVCNSLKTFKLLTSLNLSCFIACPSQFMTWTDYLPFFAALGDSCPNLICLNVGGRIHVGLDHLVALVLGNKRKLFPQLLIDRYNAHHWGDDSAFITHLQFARESVTPVCSTLEQLNIHILNHEKVAFVLRHLTKL